MPTTTPLPVSELLAPVCGIARRAGHEILEVYGSDFATEAKADASPLTEADLRAHRLIVAELAKLTPELPILSEESSQVGWEERRHWQRYWLVDPLDGTKEFVKRNGEFTVNVALVEDHVPVLGVVHVPVRGVTYVAAPGTGAERRDRDGGRSPIHVAIESRHPVRVVGSRSHRGASLDAFLERLQDFEMVPMGSSLKFCVVAEGGADVYPRLGPTSEWDTAAAQAVVEQAGGAVWTLDGEPLRYNLKPDILNPHFVVVGPQDHDWLGILSAAR